MSGLLRKLRGMLGLSAVGGAVGALLGGAYALVTSLIGFGSIGFGSLPWTMGLWGFFGATAAGGVGLLLATIDSRRTLADLSATRAALGGALVGALAPFGVVFAVTGGWYAFGLYYVAAMSGLLGAGLGAGFVSMAKRADNPELAAGETRAELPPSE